MEISLRCEDRRIEKKVKKEIEKKGIKIKNEGEIAVIVGSDRFFLRSLPQVRVPTLLVSDVGFFADFGVEHIERVAEMLASGEFEIEKQKRIKAETEEFVSPPALNDIGIFPSKSATIFEYSVYLGKERIRRDKADGVIVSTPIGSTAYSFSLGGPILHPSVDALLVTPVAPLIPTARPIVLPADGIEIKEIECKRNVELVVDGYFRRKFEGDVKIKKAKPVEIVRLRKRTPEVLESKLMERKLDLPPSAKFVFRTIEISGPMTQREIKERTGLPERTVRYALDLLIKKGIIKRKPNLLDARQTIYYV